MSGGAKTFRQKQHAAGGTLWEHEGGEREYVHLGAWAQVEETDREV